MGQEYQTTFYNMLKDLKNNINTMRTETKWKTIKWDFQSQKHILWKKHSSDGLNSRFYIFGSSDPLSCDEGMTRAHMLQSWRDYVSIVLTNNLSYELNEYPINTEMQNATQMLAFVTSSNHWIPEPF